MNFEGRINFLKGHPAFKKSPIQVSRRLLQWMLLKQLGRPGTIRIHRDSRMRLYPAPQGMGAPGLIYVFRDEFEDAISFCIHTFVKQGSLCMDIGTNIGVWSLLMSEISGTAGHVYSVEPNPATLKNLRENIGLSQKKNITVLPTALGTEKGEIEIFTPGDPGRTSLAPESPEDTVQKVPMNRLDDVWEEQGRPKISFVKMDVEGAEPLVLGGGGKFFHECRPVVTSEINSMKLANLKSTPADIFRFFREWNYNAFTFDSDTGRLVPVEERGGGDAVFIPKEMSVPEGVAPRA